MNSRNVALIIPAFINNDEQLYWFEECLESASNQNCLMSIHDDGSSIDIGNIVSRYSKKNTIFSRSELNHGVSHARNEAVRQVSDVSLILPLDCDDTLKSGAVERLANAWNGVPLYPDVSKFGDENVEQYVLMEWDCSHLYNFVGYTSVNVLHSKEQWKAIGGWDESLDFYEDGEYNARLFGNYCARRIPEPLVNYRIHVGQRTKKYSGMSAVYAKRILSMIRRYDFMCTGCSGKKRSNRMSTKSGSPNKTGTVQITGQRGENIMVDNASLPLEFEGKVLARYVGGKGKGKHYHQGPGSKTYYRNVQYNDLVYADPRDVSKSGDAGVSKLILIERAAPKTVAVPIAAPAKKSEPVMLEEAIIEEEIAKTPKIDMIKEPTPKEDESFAFRDIGKFSLKEIKEFDISCGDARELVAYEMKGSNRPTVLKYLKSLCSK